MTEEIDISKYINKIKKLFSNFRCKMGIHKYVIQDKEHAIEVYSNWVRKNEKVGSDNIKKQHEYGFDNYEVKVCIRCGYIFDEISIYENLLDEKLKEFQKANEIYNRYKEE